MLATVVPVKNEEKRLKKTIETLLAIPSNLIIPVINGSSDNSFNIVQQIRSKQVSPVHFIETLGIDIPRAVGAKVAINKGAAAVLFLDGDMDGDIVESLRELFLAVERGLADMALTDCYPGQYLPGLSSLANEVLVVRRKLNREMGLEKIIGAASPSHGPHVVSRRFLLNIPLRDLAVPPVSLARAVKKGLTIQVGASIPHKLLGSPEKNFIHSELIAETIIGDCLEALCAYRDKKRSRRSGLINYDGYNPQRRWDLLDEFVKQHTKNNIQL